jgi:integrase
MGYYVFKQSRKVNGKKVRAKYYSGRYCLDDETKYKYTPLKTTDKQIAKDKLKIIYENAQRDKWGLSGSKLLNNYKLLEVLEKFINSKKSKQVTKKYLIIITGFIKRLLADCNWVYKYDIKSFDFENWLNSHSEYSTKTKNEYLGAIKNFINWMIKNKYLNEDPLSSITKITRYGAEKRIRRTISCKEFIRLLGVSGERMPLYFTAMYTGLRRNELLNLKWKDVFIDEDERYLVLSWKFTKNGKQATLPLHNDIKEILIEVRPDKYIKDDFVFVRLHKLREFKKDLENANIKYQDELGHYFDFHALRHTYNTNLAINGVSLRNAMQLMRHSEESLTAKVYMDSGKIDLYKSVDKLPSIREYINCTHIDAQEKSRVIHNNALEYKNKELKEVGLKENIESKKQDDSEIFNDIPQKQKWLRRLDSNQRPSG